MIPDQLVETFQSIVSRYPVRRSALIPVLLTAQEQLGYITPESIKYVSQFLEIPEVEVYEVVTFYSMLRTKPAGKYHIQVCTNISCLLLGADEIFEHICGKLGIKEGETTPDQLFSLTEVECLGACCDAPAMQVNYKYHENLTAQKVDQILDELRKQA